NRAYIIDTQLGNEEGMVKSLNNIGRSYTDMDKFDSALYYLNQSWERSEALNSYDKASLLNNISDVYYESGRYRRAINTYLQALDTGRVAKATVNVQKSYEGLSEAYAALGDFRSALEYYKLYSTNKDSVFNERSSTQIARIETDYRIQKREKEIELLKKEAEIRNLNLSQNKTISYFLTGSLLL